MSFVYSPVCFFVSKRCRITCAAGSRVMMPGRAPSMITREQCYAAFLAMGDRRSLKGLRAKLVEDGVDPPAYTTLRNWSSIGEWVRRAEESDGAIVATVDDIIEHRAVERISMADAASEAAIAGFACVKRAIEKIEPATPDEAKTMTELSVGLAEAATVMKREGLAGALPVLQGPYLAAQLNGDDPIAKALEGLFPPPPDSV